MKKSASGFTIVELLIVIVVIAILAAISIVAYNGIQGRASDASIQSDLRAVSQKMNVAKIDRGDDTYPTGNSGTYSYQILGMRINRSAYATEPEVVINLLMCRTAGSADFAALATSKSGKRFYVINGGAVREYTGSTPWNNSDPNPHCSSVLPGSVAGGSGYNADAAGGWRDWAAE